MTFGRDIWAVMPKHDFKRVVGLCWLQRTFRLSIFHTVYVEEIITPFYLKCLWNFTVKYVIPIKWVHPTFFKRITINLTVLDPQPRLGNKAFSVLRNCPYTLNTRCSFFLKKTTIILSWFLCQYFSYFFIPIIFKYVYYLIFFTCFRTFFTLFFHLF